jgi:hypothetical protein
LRIEPKGILSFESPVAVSVNQLGVTVSWDLRAGQAAGEATLQVWVNYETQFCAPTHCFYQFTNAYSDLVRVSVRNNLAPTVTAIGDQFGIRRFDSDKCALQPLHFSLDPIATFTYLGTGDTHAAVIEWGDGNVQPGIVTESGGSGAVSGDHDYSFDGHYAVTITVTDNHGAAGVDALHIIVVHGDPGPDEAARCVR